MLALLCKKYPEPVSQAEFLAEVWEGGYVTSQSIAQVIRSLRVCLGDETRSIIATIPKLGYRLAAQPSWEDPMTESEADECGFGTTSAGNIEMDNVSFSAQPMMMNNPFGVSCMADIPYPVPRMMKVKRKLTSPTLFVSAIVALFLSLICVVMPARSDTSIRFVNQESPSLPAFEVSAPPVGYIY